MPVAVLNNVTLIFNDTTAPIIELIGDAVIYQNIGYAYNEQGAVWTDNVDGTGAAVVGGDTVNTSVAGTYTVTYDYTDSSENANAATQVTRSVIVANWTKSVLSGATLVLGPDAYITAATIDVPIWPNLLAGSYTLQLDDGYEQPTIANISYEYPAGYTGVTADGTGSTDDDSLAKRFLDNFGITVANGDTYIHNHSDTVGADGVPANPAEFQVRLMDASRGLLTDEYTYTLDFVDIVGPDVEIYSVHVESHNAAMAHGSNFAMSVYSYDDVPDNTATLTTGSVALNPTVTGSNPYTLTFPISRLDLQEGSYVWTLDINGETSDTSSLAYTIDGNGTTEFYGTVTDEDAWISVGYTEVVNGDNIYAVRTSGDTTPVLASCSFTGPSTWDIYIQDVADDVWGSPGTLTVPAADTTAPAITLLGDATVTHAQQATYTDAGATASDNIDGDITADIVTVNPVDVDVVGSYTITYDVDDGAGNSATQVTRTVNVTDQEAPTITLVGSSTVNHAHGTTYTDAGATASDFNDGDVTADIVVSGDTVNTSTLGSYTILYDVDDAAGNSATQVSRTVNVTDQTAPVITLTGNATVNLTVGDTYTEQGATWADAIDGSGSATVGGDTVDTSTAATYTVTYDFTDTAGNAATQVTRSVVVSAADVVPTQFDLGSDVTGAERSTATQRTFVIAGIDSGQTVSITATGSATVSPATGELGDTVTVTLVSSGSFAATLSGGATINGISDSFSITTRAQIVPTVSTQPTNQSVTEGQTATFTVAFTNASSIQWYDASDDSAISGATGTSLAVNTVLADDGNTYYAIATSSDSATVQTSTVTLSVAASTATQAPVIDTGGSTSITLTVGDTYSGDPAWTAADDVGSVAGVWSGDTVDTLTAGTYTRTYTATNTIDTTTADYVVTVSEAVVVTTGTTLTLKKVPSGELLRDAEGIKIYRATLELTLVGETDADGQITVPISGEVGDEARLIIATADDEVSGAVTVTLEDIGGG